MVEEERRVMPKEKKGMQTPVLMTQLTHDRLVRELEQARQNLKESTDYLRGGSIHGSDDWRDQTAFMQATQGIAIAASRIHQIDSDLRNRQIISQRLQTDIIKRGNTVDVKIDGSIEQTITLLSPSDAKTRIDWTYPESPLGAAIVNKKVNDIVTFQVRGETRTAEILKILPGDFEGPREPQKS